MQSQARPPQTSARRIGSYWLLTPPNIEPEQCTQVVLDSNVLIDTRRWFLGQSKDAQEVRDLWSWLRGQTRFARRVCGDATCLPTTFPAALEASWPHGAAVPDAEEVATYLACVASISMWDGSTFRNRANRAAQGESIPIDDRHFQSYRGQLSDMRLDYLPEFVADWAAVLLLLPFLDRAAATKSVKNRLTLLDEWRDLRALRGVGASTEVKLLASYAILGGAESLPGDRRKHEPAALLKRHRWSNDGVAKVSRNVTFDLKVLRIYREWWSQGQLGLEPQPTALVTGDGGLGALHSLMLAPLRSGEAFDSPSEQNWGALVRFPDRSPLTKYWDDVSDERRAELVAADALPMQQLPPAENLIEHLPRWVDEVSAMV